MKGVSLDAAMDVVPYTCNSLFFSFSLRLSFSCEII